METHVFLTIHTSVFRHYSAKNYHSAYYALVSMGMHWKAYGGKKKPSQQQKNKWTTKIKEN